MLERDYEKILINFIFHVLFLLLVPPYFRKRTAEKHVQFYISKLMVTHLTENVKK